MFVSVTPIYRKRNITEMSDDEVIACADKIRHNASEEDVRSLVTGLQEIVEILKPKKKRASIEWTEEG